jgi:ATP-dependent DNA helicase HFM1/MER3
MRTEYLGRLPEIIAKHSQGKPIIIFCPFRKSCVKTAKSLAQLWTSTVPSDRLWAGPKRAPGILDNELRRESVLQTECPTCDSS